MPRGYRLYLEVILTVAQKIQRYIRNVLAHEYFGIDNQLLWDIIKNRLPKLMRDIQIILEYD
ncbi:MAG: DUF86 domain-containing protein [Nitrospirae bacterium]|nr:DUF86 domain-containing protein [Nitrospirota bacterium]